MLKQVVPQLFALLLACPVVQAEVLVPAGSDWKYLSGGVDPGPGWTNLTFNDAAWSAGPAPKSGDSILNLPIQTTKQRSQECDCHS